MTSKEIVKLKMIQTMLETIDMDDEDDAKEAVKTIKTLLGVSSEK